MFTRPPLHLFYSSSSVVPGGSGLEECYSGDLGYPSGKRMGSIGLTCLNETHHHASVSTCHNGTVLETIEVQSCPTHARVPYCCQSGKPGRWGGASCLGSAEKCEPWKGWFFFLSYLTDYSRFFLLKILMFKLYRC